MTSSNDKNRTMTFDKNGKIISDNFKGTTQTFIPPDFMVYKLKIDLEKPSPLKKKEDSLSTFNNRMQLLERHAPNYHEQNSFDDSGKILIHQQSFSTTETRAWNSIHHAEPTYTYTVKTGTLALFKYNKLGSLTEISYFNSNPDHNLRMVYIYDENNNMIQTNRYDSYNIATQNKPDNYLDTMMQSEVDTTFAVEKYYPKYWNVGQPAVNKWKYNTKNQKIEYNAYGYKPNGGTAIISFISKWEYDEKGRLQKEIHYDVWKNRISKTIEFDHTGNVIKETQLGYDGRNDKVSDISIVYY